MVLLAAAMMAAMMAMSGVAQAAPIGSSADAQCLKLAIQTLGPNFKPSNYTFLGGTEGNNDFTGRATLGNDVFCGFGGGDYIFTLDEGDIFLGGEDRDIFAINNGTFYGGPGDDSVLDNSGTFNGEEGNDLVSTNLLTGTFNGGAGVDVVYDNLGTVNGGDGNDQVDRNSGTFYGGDGNDYVFGGPRP